MNRHAAARAQLRARVAETRRARARRRMAALALLVAAGSLVVAFLPLFAVG